MNYRKNQIILGLIFCYFLNSNANYKHFDTFSKYLSIKVWYMLIKFWNTQNRLLLSSRSSNCSTYKGCPSSTEKTLVCTKKKRLLYIKALWRLLDEQNRKPVTKVCYMVVLLRNGGFWNNWTPKRCLHISVHFQNKCTIKHPFHTTATWKVLNFMKTVSLCSIRIKTNFVKILY